MAGGWLDRVGMAGQAADVPERLSGGQAQLVAVARALVAEPALVPADEPTGSTDGGNGALVLDLLLGAVRERGAALVLVTLDNVVAVRADREIRLCDGALEHDVRLTCVLAERTGGGSRFVGRTLGVDP